MRRPPTPAYLKKFVHHLYDEHCLWCGICRPLAVAHIDPWPKVRAAIEAAGKSVAEYGFWTFHQPVNVVLLCCNCHALIDNPKVQDVTIPELLILRDRKLSEPSFLEKVRNFYLREIGSTPRRSTAPAILQPLELWLRQAAVDGTLPPPHRFYTHWGDTRMLVDLIEMSGGFNCDGEDLPLWSGTRFMSG